MTRAKSVFRHWHHQPRNIAFTDLPALTDGEMTFSTVPITRADAIRIAGERGQVYLDGHFPVIRCGRGYVTEAAQWFGKAAVEEAGAAHCARVWQWLTAAVQHYWHDPKIVLLATPASTGRDLWLRSIPPNHPGWEVLDSEHQDWIRSSAHQGRIELMPRAQDTIEELIESDLRLAYLAVARNLPMGRPTMRQSPEVSEFAARQPSRWEIEFTVPKSWKLPGLLPVMGAHGSWSYPVRGTHSAVIDGCELQLALQHGWKVTASKALLWPESGDPLRAFIDRLQRILSDSLRHSPLTQTLVRSAVRALALHTIGSLHGAPHRVTRTGSADEVPADAERLQVLDDGSLQWVEQQAPQWAETVHPEWSTHIWARARYRVALPLLAAPVGSIVAVRTDAIYSTNLLDVAADDGKAGRWVVKRRMVGPMRWPETHSELLQLREAAR